MTALSLVEAPAALPAAAHAQWLTDNDSRTDVLVGDLWLLSWDGHAEAMVMITRVIDDYVLACPVTLPSDPSFAPAVVVHDSTLGVPLTIWPNLETGLGRHLLRRNVGGLLREDTVRLLRRYAEDGTDSPLPIADGDYYAEGNPEYLRLLLGMMQSLCFHEWPTDAAGHAVLSASVVEQQGATISFMASTLGVAVPRARQLLRQEESPSQREAELLAMTWNLEPADLLTKAQGDAVSALLEPIFKPLLDQAMFVRGFDEATVRRRSQQEYAVPARAANTHDNIARMRAAIERVLRGTDDSAQGK